jgi:hypothetical protein
MVPGCARLAVLLAFLSSHSRGVSPYFLASHGSAKAQAVEPEAKQRRLELRIWNGNKLSEHDAKQKQ